MNWCIYPVSYRSIYPTGPREGVYTVYDFGSWIEDLFFSRIKVSHEYDILVTNIAI